jgi:hypothetical protein
VWHVRDVRAPHLDGAYDLQAAQQIRKSLAPNAGYTQFSAWKYSSMPMIRRSRCSRLRDTRCPFSRSRFRQRRAPTVGFS